jgi:hypothetical protein
MEMFCECAELDWNAASESRLDQRVLIAWEKNQWHENNGRARRCGAGFCGDGAESRAARVCTELARAMLRGRDVAKWS